MLVMSTLAEIKSKYSLDGAVSVTVDLESMRDGAKSTLNESESLVKDAGTEPKSDWFKRRTQRMATEVKEKKRQVALAQKYIDEINGILIYSLEKLCTERVKLCFGISGCGKSHIPRIYFTKVTL